MENMQKNSAVNFTLCLKLEFPADVINSNSEIEIKGKYCRGIAD